MLALGHLARNEIVAADAVQHASLYRWPKKLRDAPLREAAPTSTLDWIRCCSSWPCLVVRVAPTVSCSSTLTLSAV